MQQNAHAIAFYAHQMATLQGQRGWYAAFRRHDSLVMARVKETAAL